MPTRAQIQALLEHEPNDPFLLYAMAQDLANAGEHEEAVGFYERTIEADEGYCYAYYHMARSLEALGRCEQACAALDTGSEVAQRVRDQKALSEIGSLRAAMC